MSIPIGPWVFCTKDGGLYRDEGSGPTAVAWGYSGHEAGRNAPEFEDVPGVGPIPRGEWTIVGPPVDTKTHGPFVLRLMARPGTDTHGRSGFLVHGDNQTSTASHGCIILGRRDREAIWASKETRLLVVAEEPI